MATVKNLALTDLTTAYAKDYFKPGTTYQDPETGGLYVWGVYYHGSGSVTTTGNSVCVPIVSSTNSAIFTADVTDTDAQISMNVVYSPAQMANKKRGWFKCKGRHKVKECSTTTGLGKGDLFRISGTDKTIRECVATSQELAAGVTNEAFSTSASSLKSVTLFGRIWS